MNRSLFYLYGQQCTEISATMVSRPQFINATHPRYRGGLGLRRGGVRRLSSWCECRSEDLLSSFGLSSLAFSSPPSFSLSFSVSESGTSTTSDSGTGILSISRLWLSFLMRRFIRSSFCHTHTDGKLVNIIFIKIQDSKVCKV